MSTGQTVLLGAIAGCTIFLGLPLGRMRASRPRMRAFLTAVSTGILVFLFFDILEHATQPIEDALTEATDGSGGWASFAGLGLLFSAGFAGGLGGLAAMNRVLRRRVTTSIGPGAMAVAEASATTRPAFQLGLSIAAGIGLHNFSEGLAIGQAAHTGAISLATLLVVGFALHNATEGFGIVAPLAASNVRAPWRWLLLAGVIGGGPTFLGTLIGTSFSSDFVFVGFLALAAGAILYVVGELIAVGKRMAWEVTVWGMAAGFLLAFATELVLVAAGG